jgi:2-polyprenyl-3-methyl-5-hydroxy-6-metoxy-1,4-benzoquinol methylase
MKIMEAVPRWLTHPEYKFSQSPSHTAFQLAYNTTKPFFEWLKDNKDALGPFVASVEVSSSSAFRLGCTTYDPQALGKYVTPGILSDYPWETCVGSTIIDCGGGSGNLAISLANRSVRRSL